MWLVLMLGGLMPALSQSNAVLRSTNSVDIQLCVSTAILSPQRDAFQQALASYLMQTILNSNALYLDRQYTTDEGALCYLYVYQGQSPSNAMRVLERLTQQSTLGIPFASTTIQCSVAAAQWTGDSLDYLGAPFPGLWTINDVVLWGACLLSLLTLCMAGGCCYALCKLRQTQPPASGVLRLHKAAPETGTKVNLKLTAGKH
jgi:hypothetical protein